ncbi:hypothetical protein [Paenibacillus sp. y28]|uniref:hypothetical protein n=1 Tax=Paenibacillus sp. y28 TaxID=3129110 RepID=UPI003015BDE2
MRGKANKRMHPKETFSAEFSSEQEYGFPPRRSLHPPEGEKWARYFQYMILSAFVLLTIGVILYFHILPGRE